MSKLDLLWFPFNGLSWDTFSLPAVATLHDATTFVLPGYDEAARAPFRCAAARCARIITDSRHAADELARELPFPRERIDPIPLGVSAPRPVEPTALDLAALGRFVLFVGEAEPRKGLPTLAASVARLRDEGLPCRLVAVGRIPENTVVPEDTLLLGHVDDATLAALYRGCAAFAYPSRYEGFGLPVLEAMRYGAPVVASSASAIPEAGGDAAAYVPPDNVSALTAALRRVLTDRRYADTLRTSGFARADAMTWDVTAAATLAVLERVVGESRSAAKRS
jgi:glycosyltransferase involved in cell wall biosynthesis